MKVIAVGNKVTREIDGAVLLYVPFSIFCGDEDRAQVREYAEQVF